MKFALLPLPLYKCLLSSNLAYVIAFSAHAYDSTRKAVNPACFLTFIKEVEYFPVKFWMRIEIPNVRSRGNLIGILTMKEIRGGIQRRGRVRAVCV